MRLVAFTALSLLASLSSCTCGEAPGELRPLVAELTIGPTFQPCSDDVPCDDGDCDLSIGFCDVASEVSLDFSVRNIGESTVKIDGVHIDAVKNHADDVENFGEPKIDVDQLEKDQVANIRFTYQTPEGTALEAVLVVDSDASNPKLEVPIHVIEFDPGAEGEGEGAAEGEGEGEGAAEGEGEGEGAAEGEGEGATL